MSVNALRAKINKSIEKMDETKLKHAYSILKEIANQQNFININVDRKLVDPKIEKGLQQLNNGEGSDFGLFLNELQVKYGDKK